MAWCLVFTNTSMQHSDLKSEWLPLLLFVSEVYSREFYNIANENWLWRQTKHTTHYYTSSELSVLMLLLTQEMMGGKTGWKSRSLMQHVLHNTPCSANIKFLPKFVLYVPVQGCYYSRWYTVCMVI